MLRPCGKGRDGRGNEGKAIAEVLEAASNVQQTEEQADGVHDGDSDGAQAEKQRPVAGLAEEPRKVSRGGGQRAHRRSARARARLPERKGGRGGEAKREGKVTASAAAAAAARVDGPREAVGDGG